MTAPNPLVAARQDSTTGYSGIGIAESAVDLYNGISSGSWIEGGLGLAGTGLEALSLVIDPIGTLLQYGISWLIEHIKPLSDALDWLAGDPDTIASYAQTWRTVSQTVTQARTDFDTAVTTHTTTWTGQAADTYRTTAAHQSESLTAASTSATTIATVVEVVGMLVGAVREIVRDLIADCIATLIARIPQWLAEEGLTLGLATPHVVASATALIAKWVRRVADVIQKLVRSITKLRPLLTKLDEIWNAIRTALRKLTGSTQTFSPDPVTNPSSVDTPTVSPSTPATTPASTPGSTPGTVADTPTVSPGTPTATTTQSATPGTVADVPTSPATSPSTPGPGTTTPVTPGGVSPTITPGTPGTPGGPDTPGTPSTKPIPMSADEFDNLPTNEKLNVAQSEVDQGARTFVDDAAAERYGADYWNDYADRLPPEQRQALFDYTTDPPHYPSYKEINAYLRGQDPGSPQVQHAVDQIDQALAGRPLPEDVVISRGTGLSHLGIDPQDMVGRTFREDAYLSTSLGGPADAFSGKDAVLHMRVPEGTPAIWVERVGAYGAGERELLLGRGLEYRVDRVVFSGGQWHVYGEYLPTK